MSVQRGDMRTLLRVARHLNPPLLNSPPPTPYPTHTKAPPSGGWTARWNTHSREASGGSHSLQGGCKRPLDKLNRSWYNTRVEKKENELLHGSCTPQPRIDHMLTVKLRRHDNPERAISKLKNLMMKEGTLNDLKRKRYFQKPSLRRRLKRENAARQRVKDLHKEIRALQRAEENFLQ